MKNFGLRLLFSSSAALAVFLGCRQSPPPAALPEPPRFFVHVVGTGGETLTAITRWYTGSEKNLKAVSLANPQLNVKRLKFGNQVNIPLELVKRTIPPPKKKQVKRTPAKPVPTPESLAGREDFLVEEMLEPTPAPAVIDTPVEAETVAPSPTEPAAESQPEVEVPAPEPEQKAAEPEQAAAADKSMEQILAEERAAVEQLQKELELGPEAIPAAQ